MGRFLKFKFLKHSLRFIAYYSGYSLLWLITRLPLPCLNAFSTAGYYLVFHMVKYRRDVVFNNLTNAFPEWSPQQVRTTAGRFYRHFCDMMLESIALFFVDKKYTLERLKIRNPELINELYAKEKSIVCMMAHYGNWELTNSCAAFLNHEIVAIYKPLTNKRFDKLIKQGRERFGLVTVPMEKVLRYLAESERAGKKTLTYFLADQRPHWSEIVYWTKLLGQDAPFYQGAEKIARKFNMAVVYLKLIPVKRNHYEAEFVLIEECAKETQEHEIMERYIHLLENNIREAPEYWLWTHKRWKYARKE